MDVLAVGPLAKTHLKIFAHWEGVQQMTQVCTEAAAAALRWPVDRVRCLILADT